MFLGSDPYERLTNMAKQARASEAQFLEHLLLRAEAVWNFQPPLLPPPRLGGSCGARRSVRRSGRPSWETCVTLLDPAVGFQTSGGDGEPDGGALVFGGGREFHRVCTVDREPAGARVDLKFPAGLLAFQEGGPKANAPGGIAGA